MHPTPPKTQPWSFRVDFIPSLQLLINLDVHNILHGPVTILFETAVSTLIMCKQVMKKLLEEIPEKITIWHLNILMQIFPTILIQVETFYNLMDNQVCGMDIDHELRRCFLW